MGPWLFYLADALVTGGLLIAAYLNNEPPGFLLGTALVGLVVGFICMCVCTFDYYVEEHTKWEKAEAARLRADQQCILATYAQTLAEKRLKRLRHKLFVLSGEPCVVVGPGPQGRQATN